jgi:predicted dehydrogenase
LTLRLGLLGAARITPAAVIYAADAVPEVSVTAVAARDQARAEAFAQEHAIPGVAANYAALIARDDVDAVYIALPASHHLEWVDAALTAGKAVLCEKPLSGNAPALRSLLQKGYSAVLMEAMHYVYHPLWARVEEILRAGALGTLTDLAMHFSVPHIPPGDIRRRLSTAGGALLDLGIYGVHMFRRLLGDPLTVASADAQGVIDQVDERFRGVLTHAAHPGLTATVTASMNPEDPLAAWLSLSGSEGSLRVQNPVAPQLGHELTLTRKDGELRESVDPTPSYCYQLQAFADAVLRGKRPPTDGADALATAVVLDALYEKAGLPPRPALER